MGRECDEKSLVRYLAGFDYVVLGKDGADRNDLSTAADVINPENILIKD